jgi:hypothetical protein
LPAMLPDADVQGSGYRHSGTKDEERPLLILVQVLMLYFAREDTC